MCDGTYESGEEDDDLDEMLELEDCSNDEGSNMLTPMEEKSLVVRRALNTQLKVEDGDEQHENIFHMRCMVKERICNKIINGRSYTNLVSIELVEKLGLLTTKYPKPYKLQ